MLSVGTHRKRSLYITLAWAWSLTKLMTKVERASTAPGGVLVWPMCSSFMGIYERSSLLLGTILSSEKLPAANAPDNTVPRITYNRACK